MARRTSWRGLRLLVFLALVALVVLLGMVAKTTREAVTDLEVRLSANEAELEDLRTRTEGLAGARIQRDWLSRTLAASEERVAGLEQELETARAELVAARTERDEHLDARLRLARQLDAALSALAKKGD